jgi:hypothetical protein
VGIWICECFVLFLQFLGAAGFQGVYRVFGKYACVGYLSAKNKRGKFLYKIFSRFVFWFKYSLFSKCLYAFLSTV